MIQQSIIIDNDKPEDPQEQKEEETTVEKGLFEKVFEQLQECFKDEIGKIEIEEEKKNDEEENSGGFEVIKEEEFDKLVNDLQDDF